MSAYIDVLADELETEAQVAGAERYTRGEIGYHAYVRRYLALLAARRIADLEQQLARLLDESLSPESAPTSRSDAAQDPAPAKPPFGAAASGNSGGLLKLVGAEKEGREEASHRNRGAR